jgi:cobalt-zinc-cadmium efflux system outer membrane protein
MPRKALVWMLLACCARAGTLDDLIRTALDRNRELAVLRARLDGARGRLRQAGVRPASTVEFSTATGKPLGSSGKEEYTAGWSRTLETAGKRGLRIEVAAWDEPLARGELAERELRLTGEIQLRYLDAIADRRRLAALAEQMQSWAESLRLLDERVKQGDVAPLDRDLVRVEASRAEAQRRGLAGRLLATQAELRRLCGLPPGEPIALDSVPGRIETTAVPLDELRRQALARRPELATARLAEQKEASGERLAAAEGRADVTLSASYSLRNERFGDYYGLTAAGQTVPLRDRDHMLSAGVSIPLFGPGRNAGAMTEARSRTASARAARQQIELSIPAEVEAAWQRWEAARAALAVFDVDVLRASERNVDVMRQAYALGHLRLLDVLNEQRRLGETRLARIDAEVEARRGWIELEQAVGGELK